MASRPFKSDFVAFGENPRGFSAVTPNGVSHDQGDGANRQVNEGPTISGPRWHMGDAGTIMGPAPVSGSAVNGTPRSLKGVMRNRTGS